MTKEVVYLEIQTCFLFLVSVILSLTFSVAFILVLKFPMLFIFARYPNFNLII